MQEVELDAAQTLAEDVLGAYVGRLRHAVAHHTRPRGGRHLGDARVVGVEHGDSVRGQLFDELLLRLVDAFDGTQPLEVDRQDRGDDADTRSREAGQQADVAELVHGHLQHRDVIGSIQAIEDRHR